ncbi:phosphatase PAP2 family protein [Corynebacterium falsenii]|uniref:PAP2 family protein n=1 Tax=Corynebacterium falsenii TaxID=108486 RepID=A0A418Q5Y9_9CORY|nr:phosphatase PAP2 family protein [Corynebacterium falsenii]RIX34129.1 PAP2 family protein [Corynebacterium falsenii]
MSHVTGDPLNESAALINIQHALAHRPGVIPAAKAMSFFGEHALGWLGTAALGYGVTVAQGKPANDPTRIGWLTVGASAFTAHAASVVLKRLVRRPRPHHPDIVIGVGTPSKLSFPSSHATSSTAALVAIAETIRNPLPLVGIPAMALSRLVLGVHYPTDVAIGTAIGATTAQAMRRAISAYYGENDGGGAWWRRDKKKN